MNQANTIRLESSSILAVALDKYYQDFTFIVNGEEFKTSRIISDLLSPKINEMHSIDPTLDTFEINTRTRTGNNFQTILNLINFKETVINDNEIPFITEILEILCNESIKIYFKDDEIKITTSNVLQKMKKHEQFQRIYTKQFEEEIEFVSKHFNEIIKSKEEELSKLNVNTLYQIINNDQLIIDDEDQLLHFINEIYKKDRSYSILYETVIFTNVTSNMMREFVELFEMSDLNYSTWKQLCFRLEEELNEKHKKMNRNMNADSNNQQRYKTSESNFQIFSPTKEDPFSGIINHLRTQTNNITNEIEVTASSRLKSGGRYQPQTVLLKENKGCYFATNNTPNSWLKFDFKKHRIIPTDYTIRSYSSNQLRSWKIEVSNDDIMWETIDEVTDDSNLKGGRYSHTYKIKNKPQKEIRYIRIFTTGKDWSNDNNLVIESFEIYGTLY